MGHLRNIKRVPPGGWIYTQESNDKVFDTKKIAGLQFGPFANVCKAIQQFRLGNNLPRTELNEIAEDLEVATCERLGFDPEWCSGDLKKNAINPAQLWQAAKSHVALAASSLSRVDAGRRILLEWLGDGAQPIEHALAQIRANACLLNHCPFNEEGHSFIEPIAEIIRQRVEAKTKLGLTVEGEENLHVCSLCWCSLSLKVHVPLKYIVEQTPATMLENFSQSAPDFCWLKKELSTNKSPAL